MGKLAERAKELSPFITLEDGESVVGKYLRWTEIPSTFDPKKVLFQYELEVKGQVKYWKSGNQKIALFFDKLSKGDFVKITRQGLDRNTRYIVEQSIDESGILTKSDVADIHEDMAG